MNKDYICKDTLKKRGWTESMIKMFMPTCDLEKTNPYYRHSTPMHLYLIKRVLKIEASADFIEASQKAIKRKLAAKRRVDMQIQNAIDAANSIKIEIPKIENQELLNCACLSYDAIHWKQNFSAFESTNQDFLKRIQMNYLRHACTDYEDELNNKFGKVGVQHFHEILQKRINEEILKVYPHLK